MRCFERLHVSSLNGEERAVPDPKIDFLVQEGPIGAEAVVRHVKSGGLGLKFSAMGNEDQKRLKALITRLRK